MGPSGQLSKVTGLPATGFDANPAWSPDGKWLAFLHTGPASGWDVPSPTLWVVPPGSSVARPATSTPVSSFHWSPTQDVLAYVTASDNATGGELWREPFTSGGTPTALLTGVGSFLWSPSGRSIAVVSETSTRDAAIEVMPASGGVTATWWHSAAPQCVTLGAWSPATEEIAAWFDQGCDDDADGAPLDLVAPGNRLEQVATTLVDMFSVSWSPDGHQLAVVAPGDRSIWGGHKDVEVCRLPTVTCRNVAIPAGDVGLQPAWSGDGTLYFVTASGSGPFGGTGGAYWSPGWNLPVGPDPRGVGIVPRRSEAAATRRSGPRPCLRRPRGRRAHPSRA